MFKFNKMACVLLACGLAGAAWAGIAKIGSFAMATTYNSCSGVCSGSGGPCTAEFPCGAGEICVGLGDAKPIGLDADADGMAILNYSPGADKTIVQVIVSDFAGAPLERFIVRLNPNIGDLGTFLVDSQGNGHFHGEISGDRTASNVEIYQQIQAPSPSCQAALVATGQ